MPDVVNKSKSVSAAAMLCMFMVGCTSIGGYSTEETFDPTIRTVAVPIFENRSYDREVEFQLTEAVAKEIEARTPYKIVRGEAADTELTGTIMGVRKRLLSREFGSGLPQESQIIITTSIEWKDLRSGKIIRKRSGLQGTGEFVPTRTVGEPVEIAFHSAVDELAREIVSSLRADW